MKEELLGTISALFSGAVMFFMMSTNSFKEASTNTLLIVLIFCFVMIVGYGIGKLFSMVFPDEEKPKKSTSLSPSKKSRFIGDDLR